MREVVIVDGIRTAVGRRKGVFAQYRADELAAIVLKSLVERVGIAKDDVEDIILGCVTQSGEQSINIARNSALIAGFPIHVPGVTIDRQCGSSQQAMHFGSQAIAADDMDIVIAGGVENMTRSPMISNMEEGTMSPKLREKYEIISQGLSAERIAKKWGFSREDLDRYAIESHKRAADAIAAGYFDEEIIPIEIVKEDGSKVLIDVDEGPRPESTIEVLSALPSAFMEQGLLTAGNSSQMSDGASALLLMSREKADELGLKPIARIVARTVIGSDPTLMLTGPIEATRKVLWKAGLTIGDMDTYEVNEAFAPVPLAWLRDTGGVHSKLNPNGGAIALGHPLGATGSKLTISMIHHLERINGRYGLLATCVGMGMANATIIERL